MFLAAADRLSELIDDETLQRGALYPALNDLHRISLEVAIAVAEQAYRENLARMPRPANLQDHISGMMYSPKY
jgi:malate dehydrogenase (oxaloacetate-decarboxylating)(NADP+)